ncbi:liver stage antigen 1, partial [Plasmodium gaboni]
MKHKLYIYFSLFLFKWYIFRINGKLIKSENNESIKSNLRNGSVKFWNPSNEDNYGNKSEFFHNLSTNHKNNHSDFNKDNDESVYNAKNISRNRFNNVLRNLGASRDIHLQQKNLHEKGKLIEHMTNDDEDKEKYIKGEEEEGQEEDQKEATESEEAQKRALEEQRVAKEKEEAQQRALEEQRVAKEKEEAQKRALEEQRVAKEKEEAQKRALEEQRVAKEKEEAQKRALEEQRVAKEKEEAQQRALEEQRVAKE